MPYPGQGEQAGQAAATAVAASQLPVIPLPWAAAAYIAIYAYSQWRNKRKLKRAQIEAAQLTINLRGENSGKPIPLAYGYCYVRGLSVWANVGNELTADLSAYSGAVGRLGDGGVHPYLDAGTAPTFIMNGRNVFDASSSDVQGALLMQQSVVSCQEFDRLVDVRVDGKPITGKDIDGYALVVPGIPGVPFSTARLLDVPDDSPDGTENLFVGLSYVTAFHWQTADRPYTGGRLPELGKFMRAGKVPLVERTGTAGNYTYSLAAAPSFSDNAVRVLLDLYLAEDYGPIGLTENDIDLESWYHAQEIAGCIVRGAGAADSYGDGACFGVLPDTRRIGGFEVPLSIRFERTAQNVFSPASQTATWTRVSDGVKQTFKFTPAFSAGNELTVAVETVGTSTIGPLTTSVINFDDDIHSPGRLRIESFAFQNVGMDVFVADVTDLSPEDAANATAVLLYISGPDADPPPVPSVSQLQEGFGKWKHVRCRPPPTKKELDDLFNDGQATSPNLYYYVRMAIDSGGNTTRLESFPSQYDPDDPPECYGVPGTLDRSVDEGVFAAINEHPSILRYSFNGVMGSNLDGRALRDLVLESMPGAIVYPTANGKVGLNLVEPKAKVDASTVIGPHDVQGEVTVVFPDAQTLANRLEISYPDEQQNFAVNVETFPTRGSLFETQILAYDNALRGDVPDPSKVLVDEAAFEGTTNKYSAHALAANFLLQNRRETYEFAMGGSKLNVAEGDLVYLRIPEQGIDVPVRIIERVPTDAGGSARYVAKRFVLSDYAWYPTSDRVPVVAPEFDLGFPSPSVVTASYDSTTGIITVAWELPAGVSSHGIVTGFEVRRVIDEGAEETSSRAVGDRRWTEPARFGTHTYYFAVRAVGLEDVKGMFVSAAPLLVTRDEEIAEPGLADFSWLMPIDRRITAATQLDDNGAPQWNGNPGEDGEYRFLERDATTSDTDIANWQNLFDRPGIVEDVTLRVSPIDADGINQYRKLVDIAPGTKVTYFPYADPDRPRLPDFNQWVSFVVERGATGWLETEGRFDSNGDPIPDPARGAFVGLHLEPYRRQEPADGPRALPLQQRGFLGLPEPLPPGPETVYTRAATEPDLSADTTPRGGIPTGWVREVSDARAQTPATNPIWRATREFAVGAATAEWRVTFFEAGIIQDTPDTPPPTPDSLTETYYMLANPAGTADNRLPAAPPANTAKGVVPSGWSTARQTPTATMDEFRATRSLASGVNTGAFTVHWQSGVIVLQQVYRLSASRPSRDTLPASTPWGTTPAGWTAANSDGTSPLTATSTQDVWRGYRYRYGITRPLSPWARRRYQRREQPVERETFNETFYRLASATPSAPSSSTPQGAVPSDWQRALPAATSSQDVFRAQRTVEAGGTGAYTVEWVAGVTATQTVYRRGTSAPSRPSNSVAFNTVPSGWSSSRLTPTSTQNVYVTSRTRAGVTRVANNWRAVSLDRSRLGSHTETYYRRLNRVPDAPPANTRQGVVPAGWSSSALDAIASQDVFRAQRTVATGGTGAFTVEWFAGIQGSETVYRLAAAKPAAPGATNWGVTPSSWSSSAPSPTSTQDVWRSTRGRAGVTRPPAAWSDPTIHLNRVTPRVTETYYRLSAASPAAPPANTPQGSLPAGWNRSRQSPTNTQDEWSATRTVDQGGTGAFTVEFARGRAMSQTVWRRGTTQPAAPSASTAWNVTPAGWSASRLSPTTTQNVYVAVRTRAGVSQPISAWTVRLDQPMVGEVRETYYILTSEVLPGASPRSAIPAAPPASTRQGVVPSGGWTRNIPSFTASRDVYRATRVVPLGGSGVAFTVAWHSGLFRSTRRRTESWSRVLSVDTANWQSRRDRLERELFTADPLNNERPTNWVDLNTLYYTRDYQANMDVFSADAVERGVSGGYFPFEVYYYTSSNNTLAYQLWTFSATRPPTPQEPASGSNSERVIAPTSVPWRNTRLYPTGTRKVWVATGFRQFDPDEQSGSGELGGVPTWAITEETAPPFKVEQVFLGPQSRTPAIPSANTPLGTVPPHWSTTLPTPTGFVTQEQLISRSVPLTYMAKRLYREGDMLPIPWTVYRMYIPNGT